MYSIATYRTATDKKAEAFSSKDFFENNSDDILFRDNRQAIFHGTKHFYCGYCGCELNIVGGGEFKQRLHFRHKYKHLQQDCPYQDDINPSKRVIERIRYHGQEESELHIKMKTLVADTLKQQGADIAIEQWIKNEQEPRRPRRPDIRATFPDKDIVIEVQVTSTFMSVILEREYFYQERKMYLLWVMNEFLPDRFYTKDIFYSNRNNAFIFDSEAQARTRQEGILYLQCYYQGYHCNQDGDVELNTEFSHELITFDNLIFNQEDYTVYYFDAEENKEQCEAKGRIIKKHLKEEQERIRKQQEQLRIEREKQEAERRRQEIIEQERQRQEYEEWLKAEQEREEKEEQERQERQRKEEAQRQEQRRLNDIRWTQQTKLEDYVYRDKLSVEQYWQHYIQLNDEERTFADKQIYTMVKNSITYSSCPYYDRRYNNAQNVNKLFLFLREQHYHFDWQQFQSIPETYFTTSDAQINLHLYESITVILYVNFDYHLPNAEKSLSKFLKHIADTIQESKRHYEQHYARTFSDTSMIILCFERIIASAHNNKQDALKKIYNNRDIIRHLYSIYLGELVGKDFNQNNNYYPFYDTITSPYYHLYRTMIKNRSKVFPNYGLVPNLIISQNQIEKNLIKRAITPNYDLDYLMPIIFPDITWALQQSLF